jgi:hypothetical protein
MCGGVSGGRNGAPRAEWFAYSSDFRGGVNVAAGDTDGDGRAEVVTGAGVGGGPHVKVFDGGRAVREFFAYDLDFRGGVAVAVTDLDGDDVGDIVTGAGVGGGPQVRGFRSPDGADLRSLFPYDPTFLGGVFVG